MNKEELLKEAKRRFPIGSTIVCFNQGMMHPISKVPTLDNHDIREYGFLEDNSALWASCNGVNNGVIYYQGIWAKIVSYPTTITKEQKQHLINLIKSI